MMKKVTITFIISFIFLNCQNKETPISKKTDDINKVIESVIENDSLTVLKGTMFCIELKKITIEIPAKRNDSLVPPILSGSIDINYLLNEKVNGEIFFSSKDSLALIAQNSNPKRLKLEKKITDKLYSTTTFQEIMTKRENGKHYSFYEMSIPIFSLDRQKAYLELDQHCGSLCGYGTAIYLTKVNGVWKIVKKWRTWVS